MKRKIAVIMAADIAGYSKLVAEDEDETLQRLASYRSVFADFITRFSGRIFNTAGDAVFAEFASAVEAVRFAIDVQESLRARNLAYPPSRQMNVRIGMTIGDVVERDGDLLGDSVNIAARLEELAHPGGICVSRSVYEQVSNKLSVEFVDIGEQAVKNMPTPIHAYTLALGSDDGVARVTLKKKETKASAAVWPLMIAAASFASLAAVGLVYQTLTQSELLAGPSRSTRTLSLGEAIDHAAPTGGAEQLVPQAAPSVSDRLRTAAGSDAASTSDIVAPCVQIRVACEQAGFVQGAARDGNGIQIDCIRPIMLGTRRPLSASKPLPPIDPQVVAACKARNPTFGEVRTLGAPRPWDGSGQSFVGYERPSRR
jgi:class 3 adenylate cyclase